MKTEKFIPKSYTEDIKEAIEVMKKGGVILYPTDTIWGLGCDASNEEAVKRIYDIKRRTDSKAMICLVDSDNRLQRYVNNVPNVAWDLIELTEKPLTIVFDEAKNLAPNLIAEDGSVALRVTKELFSQELCYRFQKAIVSTSANISGEPSPRTFAEIDETILQAVDYVVKSRRNEKTKATPSSIIKLKSNGEVTIIRK